MGMNDGNMVIIGPRQAGKTHIATVMAVETAALGGKVLYQGANKEMDRVRFQDCLERARLVYSDDIAKEHPRNGDESILFKSGGKLCFSWKAFDYWAEIDLHVIDDVANAEPRPGAKRSIK